MTAGMIKQLTCDQCGKTAISFDEGISWLMVHAYIAQSDGRWLALDETVDSDHAPRHFCCADCLNAWVRSRLRLPETRNCEICGKQIDSAGEKPIRLEGYSYTVNHEECRLDFSDTIDKPPYMCLCCISYIREWGTATGKK